MTDAPITYETLFDIARKEKTREELQKLEGDFYSKSRKYYEDKKSALLHAKNTSTIFSEAEYKKLEVEISNIERLLKELYHRREKKIVLIAANKSRTGSELIDSGAILPEEQELYERLVTLFRETQGKIFSHLLPQPPLSPTMIQNTEAPLPSPEPFEKRENAKEKSHTSTVRIIVPTPHFVGRDLERYGPFDEDDIASIPTELAQILVEKKKAEFLESVHQTAEKSL